MKTPSFRPVHSLFMATVGGLTSFATLGDAQAQPKALFEPSEPKTEIFSTEAADLLEEVGADDAMGEEWAEMASFSIEDDFGQNAAAFNGPGKGFKTKKVKSSKKGNCYKPKKKHSAKRVYMRKYK